MSGTLFHPCDVGETCESVESLKARLSQVEEAFAQHMLAETADWGRLMCPRWMSGLGCTRASACAVARERQPRDDRERRALVRSVLPCWLQWVRDGAPRRARIRGAIHRILDQEV